VVDIAWRMPGDLGTFGPVAKLSPSVRTAPRDYSGSALLFGRLRSGTVSETRRVVHVFSLEPGMLDGAAVLARCGARLVVEELQWLPGFTGMPCERCMMSS
jgi:hypothetical protein